MKSIVSYSLIIRGVLLLMLGGISLQGFAEPREEAMPNTERAETEPVVKAWLELQSSGNAASEQPQSLSGPAMDRIHERYLKNFSHPIPPTYEHVERINY